MKILLINNNTKHLDSLSKSLTGHQVEVQTYRPGLEFHDYDKDLIILSGGGGEGLEIYDEHAPGHLWYEDQMEFVLGCDKPLIGICMGFEVIANAYGAKIVEKPQLIQGYKPVTATQKGLNLLGRKKLTQFESHFWRVQNVSQKQLEVLADSPTGIEAFRHRQKPILATQFHPEKGGSLNLVSLIRQTA
ncbi:MAG TPA: gamma-glutamyl-gamma-aminobutyrate hydrolase family protein [Candidatus Binatia bacterium]|nr:gamma-glutamyl-gamma-aminobutyrate hydrolase family protein [Candidatus Binatia bacterium]